LKVAGFTCFSDLGNCTQKSVQLLSSLPAYDRAVVNPNPADGLVAYYPFNGNALDKSGNGNDGVEKNGVSYITGKNGKSAWFDGRNDYIEIIPKSNYVSQVYDFTITTWIYAKGQKSQNPDRQYIFDGHSHSNAVTTDFSREGFSLIIDFRNNREEIHNMYFFNKNKYSENKQVFLLTDSWHQITYMRQGMNDFTYIDGQLLPNVYARHNPTDQAMNMAHKWFIGTFSGNNPYYNRGYNYSFHGLIDDLHIYNRALTDSEIKQLYTITNSDINQPPLAMFTTSTIQGKAPLTINLNAADSSDADGSINSYEWLSSTGETTNGKTASLNFTNPGEYNITLTVTDDKGATSQAVKAITVTGNNQPTQCINDRITDCRANYLSNGKLCVPCVIVPGTFGSSQIYAVEMNTTQAFSQTFEVNLLTLKQHYFQDSCAANYSPISGFLKLPCVSEGMKNYAMDMQQRRGSFIFDVTEVR
jgi:PKD repeat protein